MIVKLLTGHNLEFLCLKGVAQAHLSLHLSKCHIVENHMSRFLYYWVNIKIISMVELPSLHVICILISSVHLVDQLRK